MKAYLMVHPAYGRRYKTILEMVQDFLKGKDFSCSTQGGPYTSVRDFNYQMKELEHFDGALLTQINPPLQVVLTRKEMNHGQ